MSSRRRVSTCFRFERHLVIPDRSFLRRCERDAVWAKSRNRQGSVILLPVLSLYFLIFLFLFTFRTLRRLVNVFYSKCPSYVNLLVRSYKLNKWYLFHVHMFTYTHIYYKQNPSSRSRINPSFSDNIFMYVGIGSKCSLYNKYNKYFSHVAIYYTIIYLAREIRIFWLKVTLMRWFFLNKE